MQLGKNIFELRKKNGLSQEKLAEKINVTRQTISNWELGETSPNPEQLVLLSNIFHKSIDELLGNEIKSTESKNQNKNSIKNIYISLSVICGLIAAVWSFCANRFRYIEMLQIVVAGMIIGICLGILLHSILKYLKK